MGTSLLPTCHPSCHHTLEVFSLLLDTPWHCSVLSWQHMLGSYTTRHCLFSSKAGTLMACLSPETGQAFPCFCRAITQHTLTGACTGHCSISRHQPLQYSSGVPHPTSPEALPQTSGGPILVQACTLPAACIYTWTRCTDQVPPCALGPGHLTSSSSLISTEWFWLWFICGHRALIGG